MLITVVIPTYNRATLIAATLDSVIAQTGNYRIEVEIVDDGSTDHTADVVAPYIEEYGDPAARIFMRYTQLNKQGVVTARNTAIAQSTGEFVAFLDSDDYWAPDKLSKSLQPLSDPQVGVVHTVGLDRVLERARDVLLADHVGEALRSILARECEVGHGPRT